jgi:hypothetical protein
MIVPRHKQTCRGEDLEHKLGFHSASEQMEQGCVCDMFGLTKKSDASVAVHSPCRSADSVRWHRPSDSRHYQCSAHSTRDHMITSLAFASEHNLHRSMPVWCFGGIMCRQGMPVRSRNCRANLVDACWAMARTHWGHLYLLTVMTHA